MSQSDPTEAVRFLLASSQGPREEQQDSGICLHDDAEGTALLVICDGVGGRSGGRVASHQVTELASEWWEQRKEKLAHPEEDLTKFCQAAHDSVNQEGARHGLSPRTTIVALYLTPARADWVHSGDSRLYHFRAGQLVERTEDHSLLEIMVQRGAVKEQDMGTHPDQGTLLQSLGGEEFALPSAGSSAITSDDAFLLCTDGFWERTKPEEMLELAFTARARAGELLSQAVDRAVERNGPRGDNVTAILALPAHPKTAASAVSSAGAKSRLGLLIGAAILLLAAVLFVLRPKFTKDAAPAPAPTPVPKTAFAAPVAVMVSVAESDRP